jgi:hypothetical protein
MQSLLRDAQSIVDEVAELASRHGFRPEFMGMKFHPPDQICREGCWLTVDWDKRYDPYDD